MALPLLNRAAEDDGTFVFVSGTETADTPNTHCRSGLPGLLPDRLPGAGEQYCFHIDMDACIGCKCCVVACNEQNGNPADINWRRVTAVEGGPYPHARVAHFSMGCNHCADPTCLAGCPVDAYSKDEATGIVRHSADTCIGCQYCTWTCSYGVPQFNAERGVVGKCDMCHGRLALGQAPACVNACPEGAIGIEIVNVADWRARTGEGGGRPVDDGSFSTSRVTLPRNLPSDVKPSDDVVHKAEPHWPLVAMTVLTQFAAGAFVAAWLLLLSTGVTEGAASGLATMGLIVLLLGLAGSTLHLGRPIHAYRAMKMWRRSWLSREVVLFGIFANAACVFVALLWLGGPGVTMAGVVTVVAGVAGVAASACIYRVPSRPLWNSNRTFGHFFLTAALCGSLAAAMFSGSQAWRFGAITFAVLQLGFAALVWWQLVRSSSRELQGARILLGGPLRSVAIGRVGLLVGAALVAAAADATAGLAVAAILAVAGELAGRYLFFVAAVPRHMTAPYLATEREAA